MQRAASLSRIWMQFGVASTIAVTLAARAGDAVRGATASRGDRRRDRASARSARARRGRARSRPGRARPATGSSATSRPASTADSRDVDAAHALECLARASTDLGDWDEALATADRGLALTTRPASSRSPGGSAAVAPHALDQLGRADEATAERARAAADFDTLAGADRRSGAARWFVRQPLAARWLGRYERGGARMDIDRRCCARVRPTKSAWTRSACNCARDLLHAHVDGGRNADARRARRSPGVIVLAEALGTRGPGLGPVALDSVFNVAVGLEADHRDARDDARRRRRDRHQPHGRRLPPRARGGRQRRRARAPPAHPHRRASTTTSSPSSIGKRLASGELTPPPDGVHPLRARAAVDDVGRAAHEGRRARDDLLQPQLPRCSARSCGGSAASRSTRSRAGACSSRSACAAPGTSSTSARPNGSCTVRPTCRSARPIPSRAPRLRDPRLGDVRRRRERREGDRSRPRDLRPDVPERRHLRRRRGC